MEIDKMSGKKQQEHWMQSKWRPAMGWVYMVTCTCDFILFPVAWSMLQAFLGTGVTQWNPITLQGAGLYHLAMGAVLGVAAWSRGQEKMAGSSGPGGGIGSGFGSNSNGPGGGFGGSNNFGGNNNNFGGGTSGWSGSNNSNFGQTGSQPQQGFRAAASSYNPVTIPPPDVRPGVRLSNSPTARAVLPDDPDDDADAKIR